VLLHVVDNSPKCQILESILTVCCQVHMFVDFQVLKNLAIQRIMGESCFGVKSIPKPGVNPDCLLTGEH
jgi:hypothetical protein